MPPLRRGFLFLTNEYLQEKIVLEGGEFEQMSNKIDYDRDPELLEDQTEGVGDDSAYDGQAVEFIEYDHSQFELPDDYEDAGDEDE